MKNWNVEKKDDGLFEVYYKGKQVGEVGSLNKKWYALYVTVEENTDTDENLGEDFESFEEAEEVLKKRVKKL